MPADGKKNKPRQLVAGLRVFDRYYLKRPLGQGGMGAVWLAHDRTLETPIALKFLADELFHDHHEVERLKQETRRNLKLSHPNIVRIHDFEKDAHGAAIAMEYVDGWSLWTMRVDKPRHIFEAAEIAPWMLALCEALDYAHNEAHIVHRDLKPANLIINSRGQLKITDFGLARELNAKFDRSKIKVVGTDWYMGPQQWTGEPPAVADDIYSLGATIYELLTGKPPFYEGDVLKQVFEDVPPTMTERLHQLGIDDVTIPLAWEETVAACLAKETERRPGSARDVAVRLGLMEGMAAALAEPTERAPEAHPEATPHSAATAVSAVTESETAERSWWEKLSGPARVGILSGCVALLALTAWFAVKQLVNRERLAAPTAPLAAGEVWRNSLGMRFVPVPSAPVMFSVWETRVQDFEEFARDTGFQTGTNNFGMNAAGQWEALKISWENPGFPQATNSPVVCVTWRDAEKFCAWLTARERKIGLLAKNQSYRLPRASEWIHAAGTTFFPWGDNWPPPPESGNFAGEEIRASVTNHQVIEGYRDKFTDTAPVGSFKPNALGIFDLAGNAWEFCADGPERAPNDRWLMGGSWENFEKGQLSIGNRARAANARRLTHRGFRCVLVLKENGAPAK